MPKFPRWAPRSHPWHRAQGEAATPQPLGLPLQMDHELQEVARSCERQDEMEKMSPTCSRGTWQDQAMDDLW